MRTASRQFLRLNRTEWMSSGTRWGSRERISLESLGGRNLSDEIGLTSLHLPIWTLSLASTAAYLMRSTRSHSVLGSTWDT